MTDVLQELTGAPDDVQLVACPRCGARRRQSCTYVMPFPPGTPPSTWSAKMVEKLRRVGSPTKRPHVERYQRSWQRRRTEVLRDRRTVRPAPEHVRAAARALRDWDHREYVQLQEWFVENAELFGVRLGEAL